jgi:hypothetical protein
MVLSSEMDQAKSGLIGKLFIKGRGAEDLRIISPSLIPLKILRHLEQLMAVRILIANGAHSSVSGIFFTTYSCWQRGNEQIKKLLPMAQ